MNNVVSVCVCVSVGRVGRGRVWRGVGGGIGEGDLV